MEAKQPLIPATMQAILQHHYAATKEEVKDSIQLVPNHPTPSCGPSHVLVRVQAVSINPIDWKIALGNLALVLKSPPFVPGFDFSGQVVQVGANCKRFKVGDCVYGMAYFRLLGAFAEYVALPETYMALKPRDFTFAEAATIPLVGLTSYQSLVDHGELKQGQKILILGGSGGTGAIAVQLAKALGASHVAATCSQRNLEFVRGLGADQVIDYTSKHWFEELKGQDYDLIYDCAGGIEAWKKAPLVLKQSGARFVTVAGDEQGKMTLGTLLLKGVKAINRKFWSLFNYPTYEHMRCDASKFNQLDLMREMAERGQLKPTVEKSFKLEEFREFYAHSMAGRTVGKTCLEMGPDAHKKE